MIEIVDVKRKGDLMILHIKDDAVSPREFDLEIDATVDKDVLWKHIYASYEGLLENETIPEADEELERKWKGKQRSQRRK